MIQNKIQLRWNDFDFLGHIYNGSYPQLFDIGKREYFEKTGIIKLDWVDTGEMVITASVHTNFYSPIVMNEEIEVRTMVEKIGTKSFTVFQELVKPSTGEIKADCRSVMVGYNPLTKNTFEIPEKWRKAIEEEDNQK